MRAIKATVKDGRLELQVPPDWPDGTEVIVRPLEQGGATDEGPMTPEEIARVLAAMEKLQPFEMTPEEEAAIEADRKARKEWEKAHFNEHADKLRGMWE